ncbi:hypothetical protein BGZ70_009682, partial [Mortierella alpina]
MIRSVYITFANSATYQEHLPSHRPFKCPQSGCNASYARQQALTMHIKAKHNSTTEALEESEASTSASDSVPPPEPIPNSPH